MPVRSTARRTPDVWRRARAAVRPWNVVVTTDPGAFDRVAEMMRPFGDVRRTGYLNVLTLAVEDIERFLEGLRERIAEGAGWPAFPARVAPGRVTFPFRTAEEFRSRIVREAEELAPKLSDLRFHVRMHRRGFQGRLSSIEEEQRIADAMIRAVESRGRSATVAFEEADAVIAVDTVDGRAGLSLWRREELERYRFLRPG